MQNSLSQFFKTRAPAALDSCDSEQIHLSGMIQSIACMIVLDPDTLVICGVSENIQSILGPQAAEVLGAPLSALDKDLADEVAALEENPDIIHEILDAEVTTGDRYYDLITHVHGGYRFIELIPGDTASAGLARKRMRFCNKACAQIMNTKSFDRAMQIAVDTVRELTQFERVKIYRFLPDWSGATVSESKTDDMPSYLGLHFPATDIPKQVREIMQIVPCRMTASTSDDNVPILTNIGAAQDIDQTCSMTRSVSAMHTAYLRNMGVQASFTCSLNCFDRLWGLFACHSSSPRTVPVDIWGLVQEIGTVLMMRQDQLERTEIAKMVANLRKIESKFAGAIRENGDVEEVIASLVPILQEFLRADGFAFQYGANLHTAGRTPPDDFVRKLISWAQDEKTDSDQLQTTSLPTLFPEAQEHIETACGVLVQPILMHRVCQLIWFRGPIVRKVEWAGQPSEITKTDPKTGATLGPRRSFDRWVQEHRDQSLPWEKAELESAREIFKEFLDIVAAQVLLKEENASLREFAHVAAHDIKAPLRGITYALEWMEEDGFEMSSVVENQQLASTSARRLQLLTEGLLELSLLGGQDHTFEPVDLGDAVEGAQSLLAIQIKELDATIDIGDLPCIQGNKQLLIRLFLNLVGNALKYRKPDQAPSVLIEAEIGQNLRIFVTDNCTGISAEHAERIFQPSKRLVSYEEIEGTGLGLSVCRRIAAMHHGTLSLDTSYTQGARFVFELPSKVIV